jgi:hypothetical protein
VRHVTAKGIYGFGILANSSAMRLASSAVRTSPSGCAAPPLPTTRLRQPDPADIRVAPCIEISKPLAVASSTRKLPGISITDQGRRKASGKCHHMRFGQVIPAERCSAETPMVRERPFVGERHG